MLLVAGGQLDINLGRLLRRCLIRRIPIAEMLVGPNLVPTVDFNLSSKIASLNGQSIDVDACFIRHDVFLQQQEVEKASQIALNWYYAVKGWCLANDKIRVFNRNSMGSENNKIQNLNLASTIGLKIPQTLITNSIEAVHSTGSAVLKPPAGGEFTRVALPGIELDQSISTFPRLLQQKLDRPEYRLYRVGDEIFTFEVRSLEIDYRQDSNVSVVEAVVPAEIREMFMRLCDRLSLEFAAADFMTDACGEICFLEINTQPMYAAFDDVVRGKLCDAIIDYLCRAVP